MGKWTDKLFGHEEKRGAPWTKYQGDAKGDSPRLVPVEGNPFDQFDEVPGKSKKDWSGLVLGRSSAPAVKTPKLVPVEGNPFLGSQDSELQKVIDDLSPLERVLVGIGKGFTDIGQGAKQLSMEAGETLGLIPEGEAEKYYQRIKEEERLYDTPLLERSGAARAGRLIGQVAATAPIPGGAAAKLGTRVATAAGSGALAAGLLPAESMEERLGRVKEGAIWGGAGAGVLGVAGKGYSALRGNAVSGRTAELRDLSRAWRVPLSVDDLRGTPALRSAAILLERVPLVGTGRFREKQSGALLAAANRLKEQYATRGDDAGEAIKGSLQRVLGKHKEEAGRLYDEVGRIAADRGGNVSLGNVKATARGIIEREGLLPEQLQNQSILAPIKRYAELGEMPFETARVVRSRLGREVRQLERKALTGAASDEEVAALNTLKVAMENDIRDFAAREGGDLLEAFNNANAYYAGKVVPFKDRMIRKAGGDDFDTDQIFHTFVKNDRERLAGKLMRNLDEDGRATVKYAILQDAFDKATKGGEASFSPSKFANHLERLGRSKNAIFSSEEKAQLEGFIKLANAAKRAGQFMEQPSTGQKVLDATILGGGIAGSLIEPAAVLSAASASALLTGLLTSSLGRSVLTRASKIPEQSPLKIWEAILKRQLPRALALAESQEE